MERTAIQCCIAHRSSTQFVYDGPRPAAWEDVPGNRIGYFVYATWAHVPDIVLWDESRDGDIDSFDQYVHDARGSVTAVVDGITGAIHTAVDYEAYGYPVLTYGSLTYQPLGFAGGIWDAATETYHFGARDYDPWAGRWTAPDPSGFAGGTNLYAYAHGDPINYIDLDGRNPIVVGILIGGGMELGFQLLAPWLVEACDGLADEACLTPRQHEVACASLFLERRDLGPALGLSASGVRYLVHGINERTGVDSLADLFTCLVLRATVQRTGSTGRILFVEDDPMMQRTVGRILKSEVDVAIAGTVADARAMLRGDDRPAGLIIDEGLPDGSGTDLLRWIRRDLGLGVPAIVLTARTRDELPASPARLRAGFVWKADPDVSMRRRVVAFARRIAVAPELRQACIALCAERAFADELHEAIETSLFLERAAVPYALARSDSTIDDWAGRINDRLGTERLGEVVELVMLRALWVARAAERRVRRARPSGTVRRVSARAAPRARAIDR